MHNAQEAQDSLKYYKSYKGETQLEIDAFNVEFERLKALEKERKEDNGTRISDFCNTVGLFISHIIIHHLYLAICSRKKSSERNSDWHSVGVVGAVSRIFDVLELWSFDF